MCDNFDFAMAAAEGEYVISIGDDDAFIPGQIEAFCRSAKQMGADIFYWHTPVYVWPISGNAPFCARLPRQRVTKTIELAPLVRSVMKWGGAGYSLLPKAYHGAVRRKILLEIKERTGRMFHGTMPDVSSALCLPAITSAAVRLGNSITVNGQSALSNSAVFYSKDGVKILDQFIERYGTFAFHAKIPKQFHPRAKMLPDILFRARDKFGEYYRDKHLNTSAMWAYVMRESKGFRFSLSRQEIFSARGELNELHGFSFGMFLIYNLLNGVLSSYRALKERKQIVPFQTINEFVRDLAA